MNKAMQRQGFPPGWWSEGSWAPGFAPQADQHGQMKTLHLPAPWGGREAGEVRLVEVLCKAKPAKLYKIGFTFLSTPALSPLALSFRRLGAAAGSASTNLGQYWRCLHSLSELFIPPFPVAPLDLL